MPHNRQPALPQIPIIMSFAHDSDDNYITNLRWLTKLNCSLTEIWLRKWRIYHRHQSNHLFGEDRWSQLTTLRVPQARISTNQLNNRIKSFLGDEKLPKYQQTKQYLLKTQQQYQPKESLKKILIPYWRRELDKK